ncbi:MAG: energy transducer TonB [Verrucomicrobia bacterium]|nr:energy transducer TonB [Verrucomicrobiota bacterium]
MKRARERRTVVVAIVASLLLHFIVAVSLAAFGDKLESPAVEDDQPAQLTLVNLAPTPPPILAPKNAMFVDTPEKRQTAEQPKEKTFESNANSVAASEKPAQGGAPVPTQEGSDRPNMDLENQRYALAINGAQPLPSAGPQRTPQPSAAPSATPQSTPQPTPTLSTTPQPTPAPSPDADLLALLRATPPPAMRAPDETQTSPPPTAPPEQTRPTPRPQQPPSAYRREQTQSRMRGNISNRGVSSVDALGTPLGRYSKLIYDAVGSRWYALVQENGDRVNIGTVSVTFVVDRSGRITKLNLVSNSADESFSNLCLQSIEDAKLPPIPQDVAAALPPDGLEQQVNFTIFPNR